jgi:hypothetical protein
MSKLEKHIRDNRDSFDSAEPSMEHFEKFREKLQPARLPLYTRIPNWVKVAAVLIFVAVSSIMVFEQAQQYYAKRQNPMKDILPGEYFEAQVYYTSQIKEKYSEIDQLNTLDPERNEILFTELGEMDRMFQALLKDLQTNPSDERVLSAMITHYQMKLEVMGQIIKQLEKANKLNSTYQNHENKEV